MRNVNDLSAAEILDRAGQAIEEHGWCQHYLAVAVGNQGPPMMCLLGAVMEVMSEFTMVPDGFIKIKSSDGFAYPSPNLVSNGPENFVKRLQGYSRTQFALCTRVLREVTRADDLQEWNDAEERTVEEVIDTLRMAALLAVFR